MISTYKTSVSLILAALVMALLVSFPASASPVANASATCRLSVKEQRGLGATYVTSLKVAGVGCAFGKSVVKRFNRCRRSNGGARGQCRSRVRGLRCSERRSGIKTQFNSNTTCRSGGKRVIFVYTQFT